MNVIQLHSLLSYSFTSSGDDNILQTEVSPPEQNPIWNATLTFIDNQIDGLMNRHLNVQLWDLMAQTYSIFIGECNIELQQAFLENKAIWYHLEDSKGLRNVSITKLLAQQRISNEVGGQLLRRDGSQQLQDTDVNNETVSLLHPNHAWLVASRRASSHSVVMEVDSYQLSNNFSHSLPGSRRSSIEDPNRNNATANKSAQLTPANSMQRIDRRLSSISPRDSDELLNACRTNLTDLQLTQTAAAGDSNYRHIRSKRKYFHHIIKFSVNLYISI